MHEKKGMCITEVYRRELHYVGRVESHYIEFRIGR